MRVKEAMKLSHSLRLPRCSPSSKGHLAQRRHLYRPVTVHKENITDPELPSASKLHQESTCTVFGGGRKES